MRPISIVDTSETDYIRFAFIESKRFCTRLAGNCYGVPAKRFKLKAKRLKTLNSNSNIIIRSLAQHPTRNKCNIVRTSHSCLCNKSPRALPKATEIVILNYESSAMLDWTRVAYRLIHAYPAYHSLESRGSFVCSNPSSTHGSCSG